MKGHSGPKVEELPYFLYEICINKYWKYGYCVLGNRFLKTSKPLPIKQTNKFEYRKDYIIEKEISLVGAPCEFIKENNLPMYIKNKEK